VCSLAAAVALGPGKITKNEKICDKMVILNFLFMTKPIAMNHVAKLEFTPVKNRLF